MNKDKLFGGLLIFIFLVAFISANFVGPNKYRKVIIDGDGSGLYAYLPAIFIYHTTDFKQVFEFEKSRRSPDYMGHYFHLYEDTLINKFSSGTALLQLPFFLLAYILSLLFGLEADGQNALFQYSVAFSAMFWAFLGLLYFIKLTKLYQLRTEVAWTIAITGLLGTNLFYYTFIAPAASHAYSFSLISIFLYFLKKNFLEYNRKSIYLAAFLLALIVLVRPINIIVVAVIPFIASSAKELINSIKGKLISGDIFIIILIFLLGISPQLIINYIQTGYLIVYGYQNEGFYFTRPEITNFLVSYRKGWLVYTPFMLLLIPAIFMLYKRSKFEFFSFIGFFILLIFVFSSWWNWFYGDSFGMRPMIDYYSLFFLLIALLISSIKNSKVLVFTALFITGAIALNLIQSIQYSKGIIHPDSMNKEAYWKVFLKTSVEYAGIIAAGDESFYGKLDKEPFYETTNDLESTHPGWSNPDKTEIASFSGTYAIQMDQLQIYSPSYSYKIPKTLIGQKNLFIFFETMLFQNEAKAADNALFVVDISSNNGETVFYKKFKVNKLPNDIINKWDKESISFKLPEITNEMTKMKFYIWNLEGKTFLVDDLSIRFYEYH